MNKVILIGRTTEDISLTFDGKGGAIAKFVLAVPRIKKNDIPDFIRCVAFGKTAENIANFVKKGNQVSIEGRLKVDKYEKDGTVRYSNDVVVERPSFLSNNKQVNMTVEESEDQPF